MTIADDGMARHDASRHPATGELAGMYLTFRLANQEYGIEMFRVAEIIKMMAVTLFPCAAEAVRGFINLRGRVIPVVELRRHFRMSGIQNTGETCIVVVHTGIGSPSPIGFVVDAVSEVLDISGDQIAPPPKFSDPCSTDFILGMAKTKDSVKILLDIDRVLWGKEGKINATL